MIKEQFSTWQNQKYQKELNLDKKRAERLTILARINRYENLSRVEKSRLDDFRSLLHKQAIAKHAVLEQENKYVEAANELRFINRNWSKLRVRYCLQKKNISLSRSFLKMKF